ncbi:MAG: 2-polyprenylphenol 6-hydroxylase [Alphaproteobacteria bacterium]
MFGSVSNTGRLLRALRILAAHDALVPHEYAHLVPGSLRLLAAVFGPATRANKTLTPGERLAMAFQQIGPSAIKLGQLLATRPDVLGPEITRGLEALQDRLPPFPEEDARRAIAQDLGKPELLFREFGPPVAAASIAQVHKAITTDDPPVQVAVKVLRPRIEHEFARDFAAFRFAARLAEKFSAEARRLRLIALVDTLKASVALELDLRMEAAAAAELAHNMREEKDFRVPAVDWSRTGARTLTTEWVGGATLRDPAALQAAGHDPKRIAFAVIQTFLVQALRDGFFHADMHPGNLFVDGQGRIVAVDFGIMGRLTPPLRRFMAETLAGFIARDYMRVAQVHFDMGFVPPAHNVETFAQAMRAIGEPVFGHTMREVSMARMLEQLFETTRRFDMQMQPQLILMQKTMVVVEGVARALYPDMDVWDAARPVVENWMVNNLGPEARLREAAENVSTIGKLAQHLPQLLRNADAVAAMLAEGGLKLHPESALAIAEAQAERTRNARVALWIMATAVGVLAAIGLF